MLLAGAPAAVVADLTPYSAGSVHGHAARCMGGIAIGRLGQCSACSHPEVERLDDLLRTGILFRREIEKLFDLPESVHNHQRNHLDNPAYAARCAEAALRRLAAVEAWSA